MERARAEYILDHMMPMGEFRYAFSRFGGRVHADGITEQEDKEIRTLWDTMPGNTCYYDAVRRIAGRIPPHWTITGADSGIRPDQKDQLILIRNLLAWNKRFEPRVGDFVKLADGSVHRFSHDWGDSLQHSKGGSWYFGEGFMSFSGSLEPSIPIGKLKATDETRMGACWFFHGDWHRAHSAVYASVECRVYEVLP